MKEVFSRKGHVRSQIEGLKSPNVQVVLKGSQHARVLNFLQKYLDFITRTTIVNPQKSLLREWGTAIGFNITMTTMRCIVWKPQGSSLLVLYSLCRATPLGPGKLQAVKSHAKGIEVGWGGIWRESKTTRGGNSRSQETQKRCPHCSNMQKMRKTRSTLQTRTCVCIY